MRVELVHQIMNASSQDEGYAYWHLRCSFLICRIVSALIDSGDLRGDLEIRTSVLDFTRLELHESSLRKAAGMLI